jgi:hemoglobin
MDATLRKDGAVNQLAGEDSDDGRAATLYEAIGGEATFTRLVAAFYAGVAADPVLRAIYPEDDLGPAEERFRLFLIQYWGGPTTYSDQRGHPRLRMRHMPFAINVAARDAWLGHMRRALDSLDLPPAYDDAMWRYFTSAADSMRNVAG